MLKDRGGEGGQLKSRVRTEYDVAADEYDRRWQRYTAATVRETMARVPSTDLKAILDVGCGTGRLMSELRDRYPASAVIGMDLSPLMAAVAARRLQATAGVVAGDAENLPFADRSFDAIFSSSSFHFWPRPGAALAECRRVLREDGHLVITDWCDDFVLCRICDRLLRVRYGGDHRVYGARDCELMLREAGFAPLRIDRYKVSWLWGLMTAIATPAA